MPHAPINGVRLFYEVTGTGVPLIFVHEFAGDGRSWDPQVRFFARRYQLITYNARGYPPSDVPDDPEAYSHDAAVEDLYGLMRHLEVDHAHLCGLSMGGYTVLLFGLHHPEMARSLVIAGCGSGSDDPERFRRDAEEMARRIERDGMAVFGTAYSRGPTRIQFMRKDPQGYQAFVAELARHSGPGSAMTARGFLARRPPVYTFTEALQRLTVPSLIITGDEDEPCLKPSLFLKQHISTAGLLMLPVTGHTLNLEEPQAFNSSVLDFLTLVDAGLWPEREISATGTSALLPER